MFPQLPLTEKSRTFLGNGGGADNDGFRGFGATTQFWQIETEDGFALSYDDNGAGVTWIACPDGSTLKRVQWRAGHTFDIDPQDFAPVLPHEILAVQQHPHIATWMNVAGRGDRSKLLPGWHSCTMDETTQRGWVATYDQADLPAEYAALM